MSLLAFQTGLGRMVRAPASADSDGRPADPLEGLTLADDERAQLRALADSRGFRLTRGIQRSWCEGRAVKAASATLSMLPPAERRRLVKKWVDAGGSTGSFFASEAVAFLDFIAQQLPDPSHPLTVCQMEQAVHRVSEEAITFSPPDLCAINTPDALLRVGKGASVVYFFAEPARILDALDGGQPLPPLSEKPLSVLFAPGLPGLFRLASEDEDVLWSRHRGGVAGHLLSQDRRTWLAIEAFVTIGAAELA